MTPGHELADLIVSERRAALEARRARMRELAEVLRDSTNNAVLQELLDLIVAKTEH